MRMLHIHVSHMYVSVTPLGSLDFDPSCFLFTQSVESYQRIQRLYALFRHTLPSRLLGVLGQWGNWRLSPPTVRALFSLSCHVNFFLRSWLLWACAHTLYRLVLKSIGYKSVPVDGLPFDASKGISNAFCTNATILEFCLVKIISCCCYLISNNSTSSRLTRTFYDYRVLVRALLSGSLSHKLWRDKDNVYACTLEFVPVAIRPV